MAGKMRAVYEKTADGPVAVAASADASAIGQNTLASSTISATMTSHGRVTISSGTVTATASATSTDSS